MKTINSDNITQNVQQEELISFILQVSLFLILGALLFVAIMYVHNRIMNVKKSTDERISNIFQNLLIKYINTDISDLNTITNLTHRMNTMLTSSKNIALFKTNILTLNKLFQGEIKHKIENLYSDLGLYTETIEKLNSKSWSDKVEALNELKDLQIGKSRHEIKKLILDPNQRVSIMAMQSLMELDQHPFKFLVDFKKPITRAQAIFISKKASVMKENQYKDVLLLLRHEQPSVVKLGIQMAQVLNLNDSVYQLVALLHHSDDELQIQAFVAMAAIDPQSSFHVLYNYCKQATIENVRKIITISDTQYVKLPFSIHQLIKNSIILKSQTVKHDMLKIDPSFVLNFN